MTRILLTLAACAALTATASAGQTYTDDVQIDGDWKHGSLMAARYSSDNYQWIGCSYIVDATQLGAPLVTGYCSAINSEAQSAACSTTDERLLQVIRSIKPNSLVAFTVREGVCDNIYVTTGSQHL